ncbi:RecB family exonuclease [Streptomyces narbonensis]|uniref:RecB family exonuclease n=1 Tax=Streptomyces narbonensis TaxID=67333 RepID=UPI0033D6B0BA
MGTTVEERAEAYKDKPRSVSQVKQYDQCPYAYYLARIAREPELQAAWLAQGVAVHSAAEEFEKSGRTMPLEDVQAVFGSVYTRMANEGLEKEPAEEDWQASGPYTGFVDLERRWHLGLEQCEKYVRWYKEHPDEQIWKSPSGEAAIEKRFDIEVAGVKVIGFIDQVINHPKHGPLVRDIKTGVIPKVDDTFQLDVYALAMKRLHDLDCKAGDYWSGKSGKPSRVRKLDIHTSGVEDIFKAMDDGVKAGRYTPKPDSEKCGRCPVQRSCKYAA